MNRSLETPFESCYLPRFCLREPTEPRASKLLDYTEAPVKQQSPIETSSSSVRYDAYDTTRPKQQASCCLLRTRFNPIYGPLSRDSASAPRNLHCHVSYKRISYAQTVTSQGKSIWTLRYTKDL